MIKIPDKIEPIIGIAKPINIFGGENASIPKMANGEIPNQKSQTATIAPKITDDFLFDKIIMWQTNKTIAGKTQMIPKFLTKPKEMKERTQDTKIHK